MNPLASSISFIKENKVFFVILGLNITLSSGLLYVIHIGKSTDYKNEIHMDLNNDHIRTDSLRSGNDRGIPFQDYSELNKIDHRKTRKNK